MLNKIVFAHPAGEIWLANNECDRFQWFTSMSAGILAAVMMTETSCTPATEPVCYSV